MSRTAVLSAVLLVLLASQLRAQQQVGVTAQVVAPVPAEPPPFTVDRDDGTLRVMRRYNTAPAPTTQVIERLVAGSPWQPARHERVYAIRRSGLVHVRRHAGRERLPTENVSAEGGLVLTWIVASNS